MGRPHLGWYVGDAAGARARLLALRPHLAAADVTALVDGPAGDLDRHGVASVELPWVPPGVRLDDRDTGPGVSALEACISRWIGGARPDLIVLDGLSTVGPLATRAGIRVVQVRHPGDLPSRSDAAVGDLAPYPAGLEASGTPRRARARTVHTGLLSRFAGRRPNRRAGRHALGLGEAEQVVTVVCGRDGLGAPGELAAAARATPGWTWVTVGRCGTPPDGLPANLVRLGWCDDPWAALEAADVVVGAGSLAVAAEVCSARRPLVVIPRSDRLADEVVGRLLAACGAATTLPRWPEPELWAAVLADARQRDPAVWSDLEDPLGPVRAAERLLTWAGYGARTAHPTARATRGPHRSMTPSRQVIDLTDGSRRAPVTGT